VPFGTRRIAVDARRDMLVAGGFTTGEVAVVRISSGERLATFEIGPLVRDVEYDAESRRLFAVSVCGLFELRLEESINN